ncbi:hypothetical protein [uncultured Sulfitobacter sp.]|uniref:hypothetical protein n=1 Tax=uncultured Sulfitobacter sp. TaxID=191468 RepID=UPI0030DBC16D|tara:strand:- start:214 stop:411 length:198 start_codon:yes stop_codon:yes gene_type:complete
MTPHFYSNSAGKTATPEQIVARVKPFATGLLVGTAAPCPAPSSKLVTPSWVIEPHVIDAVIGGAS